MRIIKKLDLYVLKNFLTLFAGTFCISLFVVMMQFLWKYVDELVGKGLGLDVMAKFFFYAAETLVSLALPLAILLAALISFGNMGERLELLSIKAAGISLIRTLRPLAILMFILAAASFYFQDVVSPQAQMNLYQLRYSMMQKSPELEIPEGVFYSDIDDINLYVRKKNKETGMLYSVVIYNMRDGVERAHIILADSARLETSADKLYLLLHLYSGEQFENMDAAVLRTQHVPYRRETFVEKHLLIDFDTNFQMSEEDLFSSAANTKSNVQIIADIDSMTSECDSMGRAYFAEMKEGMLWVDTRASEAKLDLNDGEATAEVPNFNVDTLFSKMSQGEKETVLRTAIQRIEMNNMDLQFKAGVMTDEENQIRRHWMEFWRKITMALACVVFFFIGAPLGAIIRKGGLGLPVVVSVIIFIVYYVINTGGTKLAKEGSIPVWLGMWMSTIVLAPLGVFFTVKSNNDSVVFNMDSYVMFFRRLLGIPQKRHIARKEVIINDPDYASCSTRLQTLAAECRQWKKNHRHLLLLQLLVVVFKNEKDLQLEQINAELESLVEELSNSKDRQLLAALNQLPILSTTPRHRNRLRKEIRTAYKTCDQLVEHCNRLSAKS